MKETLERELKLSPRPGFVFPEIPGEPLARRVFTSTYYDTDDHRLARAGVTLRRRVEQKKGLWQLKLPRGEARLELELPGGPARPPEQMRGLLFAYSRDADLHEVAKLRTERSGILAGDGKRPTAEVLLDSVSVVEGGRVIRSFEEIEVELVGGDEKGLRRIEKALRKAGAADTDGRPKVFRALGLQPVDDALAPASAGAYEQLVAMLRRQRAALLAHDPGTRLGADPEELHDLRVATRRLRAFLRAGRPLLDPEWAEPLRAELGWLGGTLGPVRDLDVLIEYLEGELVLLEPDERRLLGRLVALLEAEREEARAALRDALSSERYLALLDRLEEMPVPVPSEATLSDIATDEFKKLRKAVRSLEPEPSDEELHATRIKGKRARYAAELAEPSAGKRAARFIARAKEFQDLVGDHQDAVVAEARIRALLESIGGAKTALVAGRLIERQRARRREARAAFKRVWKRLNEAGRAAWL
jgi:CHAD domain-containing protein